MFSGPDSLDRGSRTTDSPAKWKRRPWSCHPGIALFLSVTPTWLPTLPHAPSRMSHAPLSPPNPTRSFSQRAPAPTRASVFARAAVPPAVVFPDIAPLVCELRLQR